MNYFIPHDTNRLLEKNNLESKDIDNFSLRLNKFTKKYYSDKGKYEFYIRDVSGSLNKETKRIENYYDSIKTLYSESISIVAHNSWRLAIGIGSASVYETSITLHHIYGVPYIPAQSIKGSLRSFIIQKYFDSNEDKAFDDSGFVEIFGSNEQQGRVIFFDAFTKEPTIQLDIMNNHYQKYYNGSETPNDTQNPNPINFLTLKESKFEIVIATKESIELDSEKFKGSLLDIVKSELTESLKLFGIGAKTSVGYGYFEVHKTEAEIKAEQEQRDFENLLHSDNIQTIKNYINNSSDDQKKSILENRVKELELLQKDNKFKKINEQAQGALIKVLAQTDQNKKKNYLKSYIERWKKETENKGSSVILALVEEAKEALKK